MFRKIVVWIGCLSNMANADDLYRNHMENRNFGENWNENHFDEYIAACMDQWGIPGVAIGIIKEGEIVLAKGWGVKGVDKKDLVDEETLFPIASATKAFTAALLGIGLDQGKLTWDDPMIQYLPQLQLFDSHITKTMTIRDALCHRSGLMCPELLWNQTDYTSDEVLYRLRFLKPSWKLRSRFTYNNILYSALGKVGETIFQETWDDLIRTRILKPLDMTSTLTCLPDEDPKNIACCHAKSQNQLIATGWLKYDNCRPAISIFSNVVDLLKWVGFHLGKSGQELLKEDTLAEMLHPHIELNDPSWLGYFPDSTNIAYGLGWVIHTYQSHKIVEHAGSVRGSSSLVAFLPEENWGVVILTNRDSAVFFPRVVLYHLLNPNRDWNQFFFDLFNRCKYHLREEEKNFVQSREENTAPRLPISYLGEYENKLYGPIRIESDESGLYLQSSLFHGRLEHWHRDTFRLLSESPVSEFHETVYATFEYNFLGQVERLIIKTIPGQNAIEWVLKKMESVGIQD